MYQTPEVIIYQLNASFEGKFAFIMYDIKEQVRAIEISPAYWPIPLLSDDHPIGTGIEPSDLFNQTLEREQHTLEREVQNSNIYDPRLLGGSEHDSSGDISRSNFVSANTRTDAQTNQMFNYGGNVIPPFQQGLNPFLDVPTNVALV